MRFQRNEMPILRLLEKHVDNAKKLRRQAKVHAGVSHLAKHEKQMRATCKPQFFALRRAGHFCLRKMVKFVCEFHKRHGSLSGFFFDRQNRQQRKLRTFQLSMVIPFNPV
jgi:hypothetical protein